MRFLKDKIFLAGFLLILTSILLQFFFGNLEHNNGKYGVNQKKQLIQKEFDIRINRLSQNLVKLKNFINTKSEKEKMNFFHLLNSFKPENISISIYDSSGKLVAWNKEFTETSTTALPKLIGVKNQPFIENNSLFTLLSMNRSFISGSKRYVVKASSVLEKKFSFHNKYSENISFRKYLEEKYNLNLIISYDKYSPGINSLGTLTVKNLSEKFPAPKVYILKVNNSPSKIFFFSLLFLLLAEILFVFRLNKSPLNIPSSRRYFYIGLSIIFIRLLLFYIWNDFANINGALTNPANFSSAFAFGLSATPISLFLTTIASFIIVILILKFSVQSSFLTSFFNSRKKVLILIGLIILLVYLLLIRAFGASMRSLLFDSNLKIFNPQLSFFNPISLFHIFTIFLIASTFILLLFILQNILFRTINPFFQIGKRVNAIFITLLLFLITLIFHFVEKLPQSPVFIKLILVFFLGHIIYFRYFTKESFTRSIAIIFIASSFFSTLILQFHNTNLENALFKLISDKLAHSNSFYYEELTRTVTRDISQKLKEHHSSLNDATLFYFWDNSILPRQTYSSFIAIGKKSGDSSSFFYNWGSKESANTVNVEKEKFVFLLPQMINDTLYYIKTGVSWSKQNIFSPNVPPFLVTNKLAIKSFLPTKNYMLFVFKNGKLSYNSQNIALSNSKKNELLKTSLVKNRKIFETKIGNKNYICFPILSKGEKGKVISIYTKEKLNFITIVFENLKIFFTQLLFSLLLIILIFVSHNKVSYPRFTFKSALFSILIITSIIPMIFLAIYFRELSESKNLSSTKYKLRKRAIQIGKYIDNHPFNSSPDSLIDQAHKDLKIEFSIFRKNKLFGSSHRKYYDYGILPQFLNPQAIDFINRSGLSEILLSENIEKYTYYTFYKKVIAHNQEFIVSVSDSFNPILLPMSEMELDTVLFTIYSFAFIVIILLGLFLIDRITKPIQIIVEGTQKIAVGDLGYSLDIKTFGELQTLIDSFNIMVKKLTISQEKLISAEREAAWREMAKQVAHEIKNPLTPMKLSVQQLIAAHNDNSPKFPKYFEKVTTSLLSQIELLSNIASEFSSLGKMPKINLHKIEVIELLKNLQPLFIEPRFNIKINHENEKEFVNSDKEYLSRVIVNFIRNAKESNANELHFNISRDEENIIIQIKNNGAPIPTENFDKIFKRSFTTKPDGMGIGLYLSKRFIEQTGGSISLLYSNSYETVFQITLPKI